jgi:hypothetical protein
MKRTLKVVMLTAMAVAAFGAISAAGAQAAQFHCRWKTAPRQPKQTERRKILTTCSS